MAWLAESLVGHTLWRISTWAQVILQLSDRHIAFELLELGETVFVANHSVGLVRRLPLLMQTVAERAKVNGIRLL